MKLLNLSKQDRSTKEVSPKFLEQVEHEIKGLDHGSLEIVIKGGYILGFMFHQWRPLRSRTQGLREEKP